MSKLGPEDLNVWEEFASDIKPYKRPLLPEIKPKALPLKDKDYSSAPEHILLHASNLSLSADNKTNSTMVQKSRVELRRIKIDATIDLHGFTIDTARTKLLSFLLRAQTSGFRTVLVITGKGSKSEERTIRKMLPRWMEEVDLAGYVSGYQVSRPQHGGEGAFYVYLRKVYI